MALTFHTLVAKRGKSCKEEKPCQSLNCYGIAILNIDRNQNHDIKNVLYFSLLQSKHKFQDNVNKYKNDLWNEHYLLGNIWKQWSYG
jgi:hypothetical protein